MSDVTDLAKSVSAEAPWWSTAPIWLAAGIVGVPSLIAIMAGWFIAHGVSHDLAILNQYNLSEIHELNELITYDKSVNGQRWDAVRRLLQMDIEAELRVCVSLSKDERQREYCLHSLAIPTLPDHGSSSSDPPNP